MGGVQCIHQVSLSWLPRGIYRCFQHVFSKSRTFRLGFGENGGVNLAYLPTTPLRLPWDPGYTHIQTYYTNYVEPTINVAMKLLDQNVYLHHLVCDANQSDPHDLSCSNKCPISPSMITTQQQLQDHHLCEWTRNTKCGHTKLEVDIVYTLNHS